jgi:hypothetical protein
VRTVECTHEQELLEALTTGRWPEHDPALATHVRGCSICTDIVAVALPILEEREVASLDARIPSSAVMWWRAQMRARREAAREAARPIAVAQIVACVVAVVLVAALSISFSPWLRGWFERIASDVAAVPIALDFPGTLTAYGWLLPAVIVCLGIVLTPLAIYVVVQEE